MENSTAKHMKPLWQRVLAMLVVLTMVLAWVPLQNAAHVHAEEVEPQASEYCYSYTTDWTSYGYNGDNLRTYAASAKNRNVFKIADGVLSNSATDGMISLFSVVKDGVDISKEWKDNFTLSVDITLPATPTGVNHYGFVYGFADSETFNQVYFSKTQSITAYTDLPGTLGAATVTGMSSAKGTAVVAGNSSVAMTGGETYTIKIEVAGSTVKAYVDDTLARTISGMSVGNGGVGIYCSRDVTFDNFTVELADGTTYVEDFNEGSGDTYLDATADVDGGAAPYEGRAFTAPHSEATEYVADANGHTLVLSCCGAPVEAAANHEWTDGVCSVCEYVCAHDYEANPDACALCGKASVCFSYNTDWTSYAYSGATLRDYITSTTCRAKYMISDDRFSVSRADHLFAVYSVSGDNVADPTTWSTYTMSVDITMPATCTGGTSYGLFYGAENGTFNILALTQYDLYNFYTVSGNIGDASVAGMTSMTTNASGSLDTDEWVGGATITFKAEVSPSEVKLYIDGVLAKTLTYTTQTTGNFGIYAKCNGVSFDNFTIENADGASYVEDFSGGTGDTHLGATTEVSGGAAPYEGKQVASGHVYGEGVTTEPTCGADGKTVYTCSTCGVEKTEIIPSTGEHTPVAGEGQDATCTEPGMTGGTICSGCGMTITEPEVIPAPGHSYDAVVKAPTCTEGGYTTYTCSVCGDTYQDDVTLATGHTEEVVPGYPAGCETTGLTDGVVCTVCGETLTAQEVIPALEHDYTEFVTDATCTEPGSSVTKCEHCGDILFENIIEAKGHTPAEPVEEEGYLVTYCADCGVELDRVEDIPEHVCTPAEPVIENQVDATCTTAGSYDLVTYCSGCNAELGRETVTVDAPGHTSEVVPGKDATCTEPGLTAGAKCSVCGETLTAQEEIPALDHTSEVVPGKDATCTESGLTAGAKCSVCGETLTAQEEIPALDHTSEVVPGKDATCTEPGLTAGAKCSVCGEILTAQEEIEVLDHALTQYEGQEPTCTVPGWKAYEKCANCDYTTYEELPVVAHTIVDGACTVCGQVFVGGVVSPEDATVIVGNFATFTAQAEGEGLTYKWQYQRPDYAWYDSTADGANSDTLVVKGTLARNGYRYRCVITDAEGNAVYTEPATLTVIDRIVIDQQPVDVSALAGNTVNFSVVANSTAGENLTYQWLFQSPGCNDWYESTLEGYNTATIIIDATRPRDGYLYRCVITDESGNKAYTDIVTLSVPSPEQILQQPTSQTGTAGEYVQFAVDAVDEEGMIYQWQFCSKANNYNWLNTSMVGANTDTINVGVSAARNGYKYRCIITYADGTVVVTDEVQLTVAE